MGMKFPRFVEFVIVGQTGPASRAFICAGHVTAVSQGMRDGFPVVNVVLLKLMDGSIVAVEGGMLEIVERLGVAHTLSTVEQSGVVEIPTEEAQTC